MNRSGYINTIRYNFLIIFSLICIIGHIVILIHSISNFDILDIVAVSTTMTFTLSLTIILYFFKPVTLICNSYLFSFFCATLYLIIVGGYLNSGLLVIFMYPLLAFFLVGHNSGIYWVSAMFLGCLVITVLIGLGILKNTYDVLSIVSALSVYMIIAALSYLYERMRNNHEMLIRNQAFKDNLTELPNRNKLLADISEDLIKWLILINIDNFKELTGFYGYTIGDAVILKLGERISTILSGKKAILYKLHADEFAISFYEKRDIFEIENIVESIRIGAEKTFHLQDQDINIKITQGISSDSENILEKTGMALKYAKDNKSHFAFFTPSLNIIKEYENNLIWTRKIKKAISQDKIITYFQPIINNETKMIEKYESLVRLIDEQNTVISPFFFMSIAQKTKSYYKITEIVIEKTIAAFLNNNYEVSINLSLMDVQNHNIINLIKTLLTKYKIGHRLVFEFLESEGIRNFNEVSAFINEIKSFGCKIAIDDFGTGYSNFAYILKLNIDYIKIDASLIRNIHVDENTRIVVENIVNFCQKLKIKTIAEYVESREIFEMVKAIGVDYSQGYYFGKPEPKILKED